MAEVEFNYNGTTTIIQCILNEKIKNILQKYVIKIEKKIDDLFFLYGGGPINEDITFEELANSEDKKRNKISILVNDKGDGCGKITIKKSKYIICPKCKDNIRICINDFKISLYDCKNKHKIENLLINEFVNTQNIDESQIICQFCKKDKSQTYQNKFYLCQECQSNLCPLCISIHDKSHNIIDYEQKYFICKLHYQPYNSYCQKCKNDICIMCEKEHEKHERKTYGVIMPDLKN